MSIVERAKEVVGLVDPWLATNTYYEVEYLSETEDRLVVEWYYVLVQTHERTGETRAQRDYVQKEVAWKDDFTSFVPDELDFPMMGSTFENLQTLVRRNPEDYE